MVDTIFDEAARVELTPHVSKTVRTPSLQQVVNVAMNGLPHVQNIGVVSYQLQVEFVIHQEMDSALLSAWQSGNLIRVADGGKVYYGYITGLKLSEDYADGYHAGTIRLHEEVGT